MYNKACDINEEAPVSSVNPQAPSLADGRPAAISYNLGFTDRIMVLCQRLSEGPKIKSLTGSEIGPISLNGTILGGTLLVKNDEEWQALRDDPSKMEDLLSAIGVPSRKSEPSQRL
jgi:sulfate adenylyltransferase (ADP) / ATP adenylyltransferase